jgi:hypothetical protein
MKKADQKTIWSAPVVSGQFEHGNAETFEAQGAPGLLPTEQVELAFRHMDGLLLLGMVDQEEELASLALAQRGFDPDRRRDDRLQAGPS